MKFRVLLMMLLAVVVDGATVEAPSDLKCYKNSTEMDEDFTCTWRPGASGENFNYTLHYCVHVMGISCKYIDAGRSHNVLLVYEWVITGKEMHMWVDAHMGSSKYRSANFTMVLKDQIRYDAPHIKSMSRSSGNLTLYWKNPPREKEAIINEIQFRREGEQSWQNNTLETQGENKLEEYTLTIQKDAVYEVRIKRRAKHLRTHIWSAWSNASKVPIEIHNQPEVKWNVGELKRGVRLLKLSWTAPPEAESVGGVKYMLSLVITTCQRKPKTISRTTTQYKINVTASAVSVTIAAVNNVGESPKQIFTVPAQHLTHCPKDQVDHLKEKKRKKCVEMYELTGDTSTGSVYSNMSKNATHALNEIKRKEMKDFVRYHYFVHIGANKPQTIALCPIYKTEGVPTQGPPNVTVAEVTYNSALVSWHPIPITHQQGFLKNYVLYITRGNDTNVVNVSQFQTNYTIQNLTPGTLYIVNVAGETAMGVGPNTTKEILLNPLQGVSGWNWVIVGLVVAPVVLTIFCSFIVKRLKHKLLPEIPTPMITDTRANNFRNDEQLYPAEEELHPVILVHDLQDKSNIPPPPLDQSPLLEECETTLCEDEDRETQIDSDAFGLSLTLNPDYKRQTLGLPAPLELTEHSHEQAECEATTPVYRNGLVFELKVENASDIRTQL
ncbi:interleukin-12 receptor subunit beta-1 [Anguilla anguilla]|uniref:interleukin-12 receptor subunit beta-1 n=1 Tax=Anguilla anguilla TaxID=7936 RepID=UPI0015AC78B6|nr:interleukin-12 receptor subunit beta-1 [Anguilla anguilla]